MLQLMYITNDPKIAQIAAEAGVDRIFIDMEVLGKAERQGGLDTVRSHHVPQDIARVRRALNGSALILARVNPMNPRTKEEIDDAVCCGADIVMLPMWKSSEEVRSFVDLIAGRARTMLLLETAQAVEALPKVLQIPGVDEIHIGLNDLHLSYRRKFLFELLADGTVERLCRQIGAASVPYGFGGVARPGSGALPAELILSEHCRLGSDFVILSRSFCNTQTITDKDMIRRIFKEGVSDIRRVEAECSVMTPDRLESNRREVVRRVNSILEGM